MAHRITLLALEGCFASNVIGFIDLLDTANTVCARLEPPRPPPFEWQVVSPDGKPVRASNGGMVAVDGGLAMRPLGKVIVIPAFGSPRPDRCCRSRRRSALRP